MYAHFQRLVYRLSFQKQLSVTVAFGVLLVALISSLLSSWQGNLRAYDDLVRQGKQITLSLAQQSNLALVYGSAENARDAMHTAMAFPGVVGLEIRDANNHILASQGQMSWGEVPSGPSNLSSTQAFLAAENDWAWRFGASVHANPEVNDPFSAPVAQELLGSVSVIMSKESLNAMAIEIFVTNICTSFAIALLLLLLIRKITRNITRPLEQLSVSMGKAQCGEQNVRALPSGPSDIANMAHVFNRMMAVQEEREAELRIAAIAFEIDEGMIVTDEHARIIKVNHAFCRLTGYSSEEVLGHRPSVLRSTHHAPSFYQQMWAALREQHVWQGEIWNRKKDGHAHPNWLSITAVLNGAGQVTNYVGTYIDIAERKQAEIEIYNLAFFDPLTKLPNRRLLLEQLGKALMSSSEMHEEGALMFIDLDNFKTLNDTQGHAIGDLLLIEVARRLKECVQQKGIVARLGGDEFVLLLENLGKDSVQALKIAMEIGCAVLESIRKPFFLEQTEFHTSSSIGVTLFSNSQNNVSELLKQADTAMYEAKKSGRNAQRIFTPSMQEELQSRAELEVGLRDALRNQEFELYYQMQINHEGQIQGAEALLRWKHPKYGYISPQLFIPIAESNGLIVPIGQWVLERACYQLKQWEKSLNNRSFQLAVNVSVCQLREPGFVDLVRKTIQQFDISPSRIKLELTESVVLHNVSDTIAKMLALREIGIAFSMDDFGTGYSSLAYLTQLPLNQLKIDQSFVRYIGQKDTESAIVQTIIAMAHTLGMEVIAEGVETPLQQAFLAENGCKLYQGYLFGKPVESKVFDELLVAA